MGGGACGTRLLGRMVCYHHLFGSVFISFRVPMALSAALPSFKLGIVRYVSKAMPGAGALDIIITMIVWKHI